MPGRNARHPAARDSGGRQRRDLPCRRRVQGAGRRSGGAAYLRQRAQPQDRRRALHDRLARHRRQFRRVPLAWRAFRRGGAGRPVWRGVLAVQPGCSGRRPHQHRLSGRPAADLQARCALRPRRNLAPELAPGRRADPQRQCAATHRSQHRGSRLRHRMGGPLAALRRRLLPARRYERAEEGRRTRRLRLREPRRGWWAAHGWSSGWT